MSDLPDLPEGWEWATLDELALSVRNGVFVSRPGRTRPGTRILRISAVRANALNSDDVRYADPEPERADDYVVEEGDLLFTRYSGNPTYVGACAAVGKLAERTLHPDKLIRVVIDERAAASRFVQYAVNSGVSRLEIERRHKTTAGQVGIAGSQLRTVPIPVAPLSEQERIVAAIDEHLSRLDAAEATARSGERRIGGLERSIITEASSTLDPPKHWRVVTVAEAGLVGLGLQRSPKRHSGPSMRPYLRVANVFEDRIDDSDVMTMDMTDAEWERFRASRW